MPFNIKPKRTRFTIRLTLIASFVLACAFTAAVGIVLQFLFSNHLATASAQDKFATIAQQSSYQAIAQERSAISLTRTLKHNLIAQRLDIGALDKDALLALSTLLEGSNKVFSLFIGYQNGEYLELSNLESAPGLRQAWGAAPSDRWVLVQVTAESSTPDEASERVQITSYLDSALNVRLQQKQNSNYMATSRPWFSAANSESVTKIPPYMFSFINQPGTSYSIKNENGDVFGAAIIMSSLSEYMYVSGYDGKSRAFMFDDNGVIRAQQVDRESRRVTSTAKIALSDEQQKLINEIGTLTVGVMDDYPPFEYNLSGEPRGYGLERLQLVASMLGLQVNLVNGYTFSELITQLEQGQIDMMLGLMKTRQREEFGAFATPHYLPKVVFATNDPSLAGVTSLSALADKRIAAQKGYAITGFLQERLPNATFVEYNDTLEAMRGVQFGEVDVAFDLQAVVQYIETYFYIDNLQVSDEIEEFKGQSDFGLHHIVNKDLAALVALIDLAQSQIDAKAQQRLEQKWLTFGNDLSQQEGQLNQLPTPQILALATSGKAIDTLSSIDIDGVAHLLYITQLTGLLNSGNREYMAFMVPEQQAFAERNSFLSNSIIVTLAILGLVLVVITQLARNMANPIQRLIAENHKISSRNYNEVDYVSSHIEEIHQLSKSLVDMSESICEFEIGQKELLDAFIQLIAQAIDEKSPYTGGHCARVPELAIMLAHKANESDDPQFSDLKFKTEDQWREFEVAAWLHDCGKITTPEHIVDKGSKLECIYNRIHEIRTRFEVLLRDAEIHYLKELMAAPQNKESLAREFAKRREDIIADFEFIANANVGGEFMEDADIDRLMNIAKRTWHRTLSDRAGLSPEEARHMQQYDEFEPGEVPILADKPEHIIKRQVDVAARDGGYGFNMQVPENKQNIGELYNLGIKRGTLTPEDRYIINEHITSTIRMLETLPLPKELARVPEYAGGHHEKLDGGGYPRGLTGEQMSTPARIMAIADIFEALTANDRPYKQAKSLSQSLKIMKFMAQDAHIDKGLFNLFLQSGVYLDYAQRYLQQEQIDHPDINDYLVK
ncbi:HD domain-containing phosphohydrolase [Pseudoalteromonas sp. SSDWG2]|uniref:HD domain-containing phosphohydrolase n=1 Tax=Pseudoalteromonas sp. SSDWG2 TaxID=3139391 RepID=UPI003BAD2C49